MQKLELEKLFNAKDLKDTIAGNWYVIQWRPDVVSQERINIGVLFIRHTRLEHEYMFLSEKQSKLYNFIYGDNADFHIDLAINVAKEIIEFEEKTTYLAIERDMPSSGIGVCFGGMASGKTKSEIIQRLFNDIVLKKGMVE
jgi:hypothetical protein